MASFYQLHEQIREHIISTQGCLHDIGRRSPLLCLVFVHIIPTQHVISHYDCHIGQYGHVNKVHAVFPSSLGSCFIKTTNQESCIRTFFPKTTQIYSSISGKTNNQQNPFLSVIEVCSHSLPNQPPTEIRMLGDLQGSHSVPNHVPEVSDFILHLYFVKQLLSLGSI